MESCNDAALTHNNSHGLEGYLRRTGQTAVRTARAESRLLREVRNCLDGGAHEIPQVRLRTGEGEEPGRSFVGHNLAGTVLEMGSLAEDTDCKDPTWCE